MLAKRKLGLFFTFLLLLITVPLTVWSVRNLRFDTRKKASETLSVEEKEFGEIRQLNIDKPIYKFSVSGSLTLKKENSFFRIILIDKNQKEYLVYEAYPLTVSQNSFSFTDICEETCILEGITPDSLRIEGYAANYTITSTSVTDDYQKLNNQIKSIGIQKSRESLKQEQESLKIKKLNEQIKAKGMSWIAGETSVSKLIYEQKKKLFSKPDGTPVETLPNLQGFEYYKGGIFEIKSANESNSQVQTVAESSDIPQSWDWRNVHGENWNTPIRDQGQAGTCWAFARIGTIESQINLYFNQHLNVDLSEQMLVDCEDEPSLPLGMDYNSFPECSGLNYCNPGSEFCVIRNHGIPDEQCSPYAKGDRENLPAHCNLSYVCNNWQNRIWKISDFLNYKFVSFPGDAYCPKNILDSKEDDLKKTLISKGPMQSRIDAVYHAMTIEGYNTNSDWKTIDYCGSGEICHPIEGCITETCDNPGEEKTFCYNDSYPPWGSKWGNLVTFKCGQNYYWNFEKTQYCSPGGYHTMMVCKNNTCISSLDYTLNRGDKECKAQTYYISMLKNLDFAEYAPGEKNPYWIFKNSWGENWGEEGYLRIGTSVENLTYGSLPLGPFIPPSDRSYWPAGFDGTIKCVDKDNDTYCNWGISENKPDTCPAFCKPQKDCDDSNPNLGPFDENLNCTLLNISPSPIPTTGDCCCVDGCNTESYCYFENTAGGCRGEICETAYCSTNRPTPTTIPAACVSEYNGVCWSPQEAGKDCCVANVPQASCEQTANQESSCIVFCSQDGECPVCYPKCLRPGGYCISAGNLNCDTKNLIDEIDLSTLLAKWAARGGADLNGDGNINGADLNILLSNWKTK